jgi:hypothetical protein
MIEIIFTVAVYIIGAITENETNGKVTAIIGYNDNNITVECKGK